MKRRSFLEILCAAGLLTGISPLFSCSGSKKQLRVLILES